MNTHHEEFDFVIIGSGFGGSVSAMRLAEKGYKVAVLEAGKRWRDEDFPKSNLNIPKYAWLPWLRCFGIQKFTLLNKIFLLHGAGVGGGSLVYANTLMIPHAEVFKENTWPSGVDWNQELAGPFETAKKMLGVATNPRLFAAERVLQKVSEKMGVPETFHATEVGVFFGEAGKTVSDPYFNGKGPDRAGCNHCGGCMVGCRHNAKNTLVKNYLYFAEKLGVKIFAETTVDKISPNPQSNGYVIETFCTTSWFKGEPKYFKAKKVIMSAGVLGTLKLLFKNRDDHGTLSKLSACLGHSVRTNGESLLGVTRFKKFQTQEDSFSQGIAIGAAMHPDALTKIETVKYPTGSNALRPLAVPLTGDGNRIVRPLKMLVNMILRFPQFLRMLAVGDWAKQSIILLVMQSSPHKVNISFKRFLFGLGWKRLSADDQGSTLPTYLPVAQKAAQIFADHVGGEPQNVLVEAALGITTTAHILGGCVMGNNADQAVVDLNHEVFGHKGLYVCDGSNIAANLGVNPSLTIAALAERFAQRFPNKKDNG